MKGSRILIVEDEKIAAKDIGDRLKRLGYAVTVVASSGAEAITKASQDRPDLILMDVVLKRDLDGISTAEKIRSLVDVPIIYLTALADKETFEWARRTGPYGYIIKPFKEEELYFAIEIALYRHGMEKQVREAEKNYRDLFDSAIDGIFRTDTAGVFTLANPATARILGYDSPEEMLGKSSADHWFAAEEREVYLRELRASKSVRSYIVRCRRGNGETGYLEISSRILQDKSGSFLGAEGVLRDVTERRKMEDRIFEISQDWKDTFNSLTDIVTVHDGNFNIIRANRAAERMLGLPFAKTPETKCYKYYHGSASPPEGCPGCDCLKTGKPATVALFEPHLNMFIEIRAIPRFDSRNRLVGLIHIVRDVRR